MLVGLIDVMLTMLTLAALVPAGVLFLELVVAKSKPSVRGAGPLEPPTQPRRFALAVLMPAHDEAAGITPAILAVRAQLGPHDRLLVVADNCDDATAAIARTAGAEVIERHDAVLRGKGYALDFGVRWLASDAPAAVVIVDADCIVGPGAIDRLAERCLARARPVQALYLMHAPPGASLRQRIAEFAWLVKNKLRPLGAESLGWPCQLMGTGMAFPWAIIAAAPLATGHLVEDMQLGLDLAAAGTPPEFCASALVSSSFPSDGAAVGSQRTRWEHGHLSVIASIGPSLLSKALRRGDMALLGMTLDLMVPPLAALVLGTAALWLLDALWWIASDRAAPFTLASAALLLIGSGVMKAWSTDGRRIVTLAELASIPLYVAAKIPVYARLLTKRQTEWVRTRRDDRRD